MREQIVYGSAYPLRPVIQTVEDTRELPFENAVLDDYFAGNAKRIFGIH